MSADPRADSEPVRYADLVSGVTAGLPPLPLADLGEPPLIPLRKPLEASKVVVITSAGVRLRSQPAFAPVNDLSWRSIPASAAASELVISHPTPVRRPAEADVNVVFPVDRLRELTEQGLVGQVAADNLSFLGTIKRLTALVTELAPSLAASVRELGGDAAVLVPL